MPVRISIKLSKMKRKLQVGVMGPGRSASEAEKEMAFKLGKLIAQKGWTLISGGRNYGVMGAVNRGYHKGNGSLAIGISPEIGDSLMSSYLDAVISTGMGSGRNIINALSCDVMISIGDLSCAGTLSEVALKLNEFKKHNKKKLSKFINLLPILLGKGELADTLDRLYSGVSPSEKMIVDSPEKAIARIEYFLSA